VALRVCGSIAAPLRHMTFGTWRIASPSG